MQNALQRRESRSVSSWLKRQIEKGYTVAQLAVAWILSQPGITSAIIGPRTLGQLEDLLPSAGYSTG